MATLQFALLARRVKWTLVILNVIAAAGLLVVGSYAVAAHRTHAYQRLARRYGSHARVTIAVIIVDVVWLFPCAALAVEFPSHAPWICTIALVPLAVCAFLAGAGRPE